MNNEGNLVLTRKEGEEIISTIPPSKKETTFSLSVSSIKPNQVRLFSHAPMQVNIARRELI